jgi:hypothetical protein
VSRRSKLQRQLKGFVRERERESVRLAGYKAGHDEGRSKGYYEGDAAGFKRSMDERTLYVAPPRAEYGVAPPVLLQDEPRQDHVVVPLFERADLMSPFTARPMERFREQRIVFRAIRKGFALPNGGSVIWWDWEVRR